VLRRLFYDGLPKRIKDDIARVGKPSTLSGLRNLAQTFDACYWERKSEVTQHAKSSTPSNVFNKTHIPFRPAPSLPSNPAAGSKAPKDNKKSEAKPAKIDLSSKLGDNGKLTMQECKRCFDEKLCMFCGQSGHMVKDCPKASSHASKAHLAKTMEQGSASTDAKK
jgi:hypothetical protein